ncbi:MAG: GTPase ObgE [Anaerolineales bacterium]|nr:GTPase ObgE [Anaerolineales bacterium]
MFIDQAQIHIRSGKGGDGVVHFRKEKYVPFGGPDGGDGGKGGDIILEVEPSLNTLSSFRQKNKYFADNGDNGRKQKMTGKSGKDLIIKIPPGTIVYEDHTGEVLGDLVTPGQRYVAASGGRGGRGNVHFANSRNQVPRVAERGEPGVERFLRLELKLIADIGIIGVPNAGKSTLLASVTNAKPKIAPYPFTTLEPNLGVVELDDEIVLVLADIPGLIEGAHKGVGLGYAFLKHIQRTRVLIHLLDGLAENPVLDYAQINSELALFDPGLADKPQIVVLNKMDIPEAEKRYREVSNTLKKQGVNHIWGISAVTGMNVKTVLYQAAKVLQELPEHPPEVAETPVYKVEADPRHFQIKHTAKGWLVIGDAIERAASMTYWEYDQSIRRFQRILQTLGIEDALREAGVQSGDTVIIGEYELEWAD